MKEIKFRAWDKNIDTMVDPEDLWMNGTGLVARYYQNCDEEESGWERDPEILNKIELLQYTGLLDKNGKEIYEGDITGDTRCPDEYYVLGKVAYCNTADCMYAGQFMLQDKEGYATDWDGVEPEHWHKFEVIGNIYENPELLGEIIKRGER